MLRPLDPLVVCTFKFWDRKARFQKSRAFLRAIPILTLETYLNFSLPQTQTQTTEAYWRGQDYVQYLDTVQTHLAWKNVDLKVGCHIMVDLQFLFFHSQKLGNFTYCGCTNVKNLQSNIHYIYLNRKQGLLLALIRWFTIQSLPVYIPVLQILTDLYKNHLSLGLSVYCIKITSRKTYLKNQEEEKGIQKQANLCK